MQRSFDLNFAGQSQTETYLCGHAGDAVWRDAAAQDVPA